MNKLKSLPMKLFTTLLFIVNSPLALATIEQNCSGSTTTTPSNSFIFDEAISSITFHDSTELMWARCVVGQTWNEEDFACEGEPVRLSWQMALQLSDDYVYADYTDWRLPNIKELASIVEHACVSPSSNESVFSNTPNGNFWTSTPNTSADKTTEAWAVAFSNGRIDSRDKHQDYYVRMVRYAE